MTMTLEQILPLVEKPARYVGAEYNTPDMDKPCITRVCMCFPELYEIGMSNIGVRILYHMLNDMESVVCQRCFAPQLDMAALMQENELELFSLETKTPLKQFDIVGFSIGYEMLYTNVLYMLELAKLPFYAKDRGESFPILIAGGPCVINPEPFADFFDLILIGEGEVNLKNLVQLYTVMKAAGSTKAEFIAEAANLGGIYAPHLKPSKIGAKVVKSVAQDLDKAYYPTKILTPNIEITHDRAVLELYRGCANGCRFCQAGFYYRPIRMRSKNTLVRYGKELINNTGYDELSLASLSTGDYPQLLELITELKSDICTGHVRLAMPSLRLDSYKSEYMVTGRMGSLTFAPEAGTERLRRVINKNITAQNITDTITTAIEMGYKGVKLYFMIGLPTETLEDMQGIVDIVQEIRKTAYAKRKNINITVSTSVFIPKPVTPFQWERQITIEEMQERQQFLKNALRIKGVRYNWHDPFTSVIEAVLARGDRQLSQVVVKAYELGARFDGWSEHFKYEIWQQAFEQCDIHMEDYTCELPLDKVLPWDFIDCGINRDYMLAEREKAYTAQPTVACGKSSCLGCGANKLGKCYIGN